MYRKEVNEHSPMRIFERSMRGGLGKGNVGVIAARPGIGKTAFLVQIALDVLLRYQKVLHISLEHAVDRVRAFYDELFHDIVITYALAGPQAVRLELERNRLIYSHLEAARDSPPSLRGGTSSVGRIQETIDFAKQCAGFTPDVLIIDGFDFHNATSEAVDELTKLAKALDAEVWLSAKTDEYTDVEPGSSGPGVTPEPIASFFDQVAVSVLLW